MRHYLSATFLCMAMFLLGSCQSEKTDYVAFLYKYMPTSDSVDYSREYWERQVAMSERARKEMPWAKLVPETEWKHFVVPVRVNNESLDDARSVIYEELGPVYPVPTVWAFRRILTPCWSNNNKHKKFNCD